MGMHVGQSILLGAWLGVMAEGGLRGARVRHDYAETLTDLYVDEHLRPLQEWATEHGVKFRAQAAFARNEEV